MAIGLYDKAANRRLFSITDDQLAELQGALEEESAGDRDYYVDAAVCDYLDGKVAADVVARLRDALGLPAAGEGVADIPRPDEEGVEEELDAGAASGPGLDESGLEIEWRRE